MQIHCDMLGATPAILAGSALGCGIEADAQEKPKPMMSVIDQLCREKV
jgi:hypothetical protein